MGDTNPRVPATTWRITLPEMRRISFSGFTGGLMIPIRHRLTI